MLPRRLQLVVVMTPRVIIPHVLTALERLEAVVYSRRPVSAGRETELRLLMNTV